ncbi:signal peptidase I [Streptomyces tsukubensis]|uniref:Signal peptidase I n=1 Tax=Streptomyces tsukubensis (strain DSM 42081 / NBRC 108919 / NRRL 18488 / 9993) TaxID=1114943 RepID=A0A7G3UA51_STRT9|nr:signal peptidase I [Streptomyces tsukubensis]QKM67236.1 signal peptidase I [Streptomyces tsukubensis NRRL18488]TAI41939.1 signal peptidase I [Streptomyces tsukubensis]
MGRRGRPPGRRTDAPLPTGTRPTDGSPGSPALPGPSGMPAPSGRAERRRLARKVRRRRRRSALKEIPLLVGVALLIALVLKTFLVQAFVIPSGSMEQTIRIDDRVLVDKLTPWFGSEPERGDVVVFKDPGGWLASDQALPGKKDDPIVVKQIKQGLTFIGLLPSEGEQDLIKRVVAIGGDTVACCDKDGRVTVNGVPLIESYINPGNVPSARAFEVKVPKGRLFVMGDHRADSADSRAHLDEEGQGTVAVDEVVGRAVVIAWPVRHWTRLDGQEVYSSVPNVQTDEGAATGPSHTLSSQDHKGMAVLPSPAELSLVMGVTGLLVLRRLPGPAGGRFTHRLRS